ncbi:GMP-PDE, delta subunit-domain-containing protein [Fimicolochytrium jonesii]|uniref:GMP-PDE, delta subunit-domain-containing protein n=1 Tax=Fimicolochytrium jonesii TaxID=1396493 RepID=UPI0022FE0CB5|nr:GMP-PDE, delta subunit-domain-containing protein [Fimicolochytrium jonesii]KAI8821114.1 GMP-PDE, delta subunit-domain-containing protein [Fimicolochytrium jonesii]
MPKTSSKPPPPTFSSRSKAPTKPMSKSSASSNITPETVLKYDKPSEGFLCPIDANKYFEFLEFRIRDMESNKIIFEVLRPSHEIDWTHPTPPGTDDTRTITYTFLASLLATPTIGTTLVFAVCPQGIPNFRMIERHYFKGRLIKGFDFVFGFCVPGSVNTWEAVYEMPEISQELQQEMIASPDETTSDSFYFIDDRLVMHTKALYRYEESGENDAGDS